MDKRQEARQLIAEALLYLDSGMITGVTWRLADAMYWLKKENAESEHPRRPLPGIHSPTGLGNSLNTTR